jgi:hypothetical protein
MKHKIFIYFYIVACLGYFPLLALDSLLSPKEEPRIFVNNRILAQVNGKPISTFDLMKKMDLAFYRQYPEYASSIVARYDYYQMGWKHILEEIIDKELILADAQESKIEVTNGDVRQEIESAFGPNIIANLDRVELTFDEAFKIIQEELIIRRMLGGRVHNKAIQTVTPTKVRQAYETFIQDPANARHTQWVYRTVTIKDRRLAQAQEVAHAAYKLLMEEGVTLEELTMALKDREWLGRKTKITLSNPITQNDSDLSKDYHEVLSSLNEGSYSEPFIHRSRSNQMRVYRILTLQQKIPGGIPSFKEMEASLKDKLMEQAIDQETVNYLQKLRQHYHIRESDLDAFLPANYQPFSLTGLQPF